MESTYDEMNLNCTTDAKSTSMKAYTIGGVPIIFPYKAYPSQITMMDKIVKCLNKKFNCLLESPTGSGKSLALLCACLAWQKKTKKALDKLEQQLEMELMAHGAALPDEGGVKKTTIVGNLSNTENFKSNTDRYMKLDSQCCSDAQAFERKGVSKMPCLSRKEGENPKRGIIYLDDDDMEDFKPMKKYKSSTDRLDAVIHANLSQEESLVQKQNDNLSTEVTNLTISSVSDVDNPNLPESANVKDKTLLQTTESLLPSKLPKIYFGTRTHKQIDQIIRELKKTPYKDSKITILSSRERTCIHPEASHADNKNEACDELLKSDGGPACKFYRMAKTINHYHPSKLSSAFDLEDFVGICKRARACPYFSARELLPFSDIVFCPYNYLVDPLIRSALSINLKNSIIVMDEAHNIEDSARDAASSSISLTQLEESIINLEKVGRHSKDIQDCYTFIAKILSNLVSWVKGNLHNLSDYATFDSSAKVWSGDDLMTVLQYVEMGPDSFPDFKKKFEKILAEESDPEEEKTENLDEPKLLASTSSCLKSLTQMLTYLYKNELAFVPDYRLVIVKNNRSFVYTGKRSSTNSPVQITLNFWCLNPAVAFSDVKDITHSVIVASGTLSPLTSFQSELGMPFQITLEANHVVSKAQMWVGTIGQGPNNCILNANYHNSATFAFQDDIGCLVFQVCCVIPHGILCFLPSYSMLDKLVNRWQQTGMWDRLSTRKLVLSEPRKQSNFLQIINDFYEAVKETECSSDGTKDGALLLAVCRGKVSEGLDFADSNARAVITIGIPFPNIKDAQVDLKRKYNDVYAAKKHIMTGSEWYEIQAFRALNQALGRCIRHRDDYGALIIVDQRFQKNSRFPNALSKWIRKEIEHFPHFPAALNSLNSFAERTGLKKSFL